MVNSLPAAVSAGGHLEEILLKKEEEEKDVGLTQSLLLF